MQPVMQREREPEPVVEEFVELPSHSRLPRLDLGVDWGSPWNEFVRACEIISMARRRQVPPSCRPIRICASNGSKIKFRAKLSAAPFSGTWPWSGCSSSPSGIFSKANRLTLSFPNRIDLDQPARFATDFVAGKRAETKSQRRSGETSAPEGSRRISSPPNHSFGAGAREPSAANVDPAGRASDPSED